MIQTDKFAKVEIRGADALWDWLADHHEQDESVWLVTWKKDRPERYVSRDAVLDALVAHGWIDGIRRKLDAARTMQLISPRKQQAWAESYKRRAAQLEQGGLLREPGRAAIARAKAAGSWEAMAAVDSLEVPADLQVALDARREATATFAGCAPSYRRNVLRWIAGAKRPATRAKRVAVAADHAAAGTRVPQM
jgi:uncharacterized protein YdeI (YjbR/CyaY-like superfamily)